MARPHPPRSPPSSPVGRQNGHDSPRLDETNLGREEVHEEVDEEIHLERTLQKCIKEDREDSRREMHSRQEPQEPQEAKAEQRSGPQSEDLGSPVRPGARRQRQG